MKRLIIMLAVIFLTLCSVHAEPLSDWLDRQTERDTLRLVRLAMSKVRTGTTPSDIQTRLREQWESQKRVALRYVMTGAGIDFADLQSAVTVRNKIALWVRNMATVNDKTDVLATYIPVFWAAYVDYRSRDISEEDDALESYEAGKQPIYADSPATVNGWGVVTGDDIEASQQ